MERHAEDIARLLERITINPDICHGKPCIRGLRYPVSTILELLSAGMSIEEVLVGHLTIPWPFYEMQGILDS